MFVPPYMPHVEANMSTEEELIWLTCRTLGDIINNFPEIDDTLLAGFRRS